jgi:tripartite ATP-independent transporter DctM subunit
MSPELTGALGLAGALLLMAARVPIGAALGVAALAGISLLRSPTAALGMLGTVPHEFAGNWILSAVPMFLLMGAFAYHMGLTQGLYEAARAWLGRLPGGLAIASNWACTAFGAASGSSLATTAAMGRLAIPEMLKSGYDPALATGSVAAAGTIAALIPPSIAFVIYGWYSEQPIDKLLIAGVLPGLLTAAVFTAFIVLLCTLRPQLAPRNTQHYTWGQRLATLKQVWPIPVMVAGVIGFMWLGIATSTEAAAIGAALTVLMAVPRGGFTWSGLWAASRETVISMASLFFVIIGAVLFTRFMALSGLPVLLAQTFAGLGSPILVIAALIVVYVILGMFLDPVGVMMLTLPVFLPICRELNMDLLWIGVLVVKLVEVGMLTPPVGLHCFVLKSIAGDKVPLTTIFRGAVWFLSADALVIALLVFLPSISLFLPGTMK